MQKLRYLQDWQPIREQASPLPRDPARQAQWPNIHTTVTCEVDSRRARSASVCFSQARDLSTVQHGPTKTAAVRGTR